MKRILVIDDEPDVVTYIATVLQDAGYVTDTAADGEEATEKLKQKAPDLITLDITMPAKSGVRFYRDVKESEQWQKIPVVIVTGVSEDFKRFISTRKQVPPPEGYLQKPISKEALLEVISKLLGAD